MYIDITVYFEGYGFEPYIDNLKVLNYSKVKNHKFSYSQLTTLKKVALSEAKRANHTYLWGIAIYK